MKAIFSATAQGRIRLFLIPVAIISSVIAIFLWQQQVQVDPAYVFTCNLEAVEQVTSNCINSVFVAVNRKFDVVSEPDQVIGKWTVHAVNTGELVHPSQLVDEKPDRFKFINSGEALPEGLYGYHITVEDESLTTVSPQDLLTLSIADSMTGQLIVILDKAVILSVDETGIWVGVRLKQVAAIENLLELTQPSDVEDEEILPPRLVWTITQGANPDLPPLIVFDMALTRDALASEGD